MTLVRDALALARTFNPVTISLATNLLTLAFFNQSNELTLDTIRKALAVAEKAREKTRQRDGVARAKPITQKITLLRNRLRILEKMQASLDAGTIAIDFPTIRSFEEYLEASREANEGEDKAIFKARYGVTLYKDGKIIILMDDFVMRSRILRSKVAQKLADAQALVAFTEFASEALVDVFSEYTIEDGLEAKYVVSEDGLSVTKIL